MARLKKETVNSILRGVPQENIFWCRNGRVLDGIYALRDALKEMNNETFRHHVDKEKNDFSSWVKDVVGDEKLSKDLLKGINLSSTMRKVEDRVAFLELRK